ncbi:MAG: 6-phosphofructokinase, partial [Thermoguttaceae bacterium]
MRIGVLCSGGDAPGMNPCIRSIVRSAYRYNDEIIGVMHGYQGIFDEDFYTKKDFALYEGMGMRMVSGLTMQGGTILHSSRCMKFTTEEGIKEAVKKLKKHKFDALLPIGGNGTMTGAYELSKYWDGQIIGLPGTIDNDLLGTDVTIGFA